MATTTDTANPQMSLMDRLGILLGMGNEGTSDPNMTVPTPYNTSSAWTPPGSPIAGKVTPTGAGGLGAGLGMNVGTGQLALGGLGALAGVWNSMNQNKMAKDQFNFQKDFANTNLNNSIKSYNTSLEDRLNARGAVQGDSSAMTQDQIARNRLSR
ncbi:hypothetical protein D3C85_662360 [compost metagenome]